MRSLSIYLIPRRRLGGSLEETHVDVRHDGHGGDHGRAAVHRHDVPSPARCLSSAGENFIVRLQLAERIRTGSQVRMSAAAAAHLGDHGRPRWRGAASKRRRFLPFATEIRIEGAVFGIQDVDLIMAVGTVRNMPNSLSANSRSTFASVNLVIGSSHQATDFCSLSMRAMRKLRAFATRLRSRSMWSRWTTTRHRQ